MMLFDTKTVQENKLIKITQKNASYLHIIIMINWGCWFWTQKVIHLGLI